MKEKFIAFLKRENVYERFVENLLDSYTNSVLTGDFIMDAFLWDDDNFWTDIHNKWQEELS